MAITINGSGTITGVSVGGLPDGSITADDLASTLDISGKTVTLPSNVGGITTGKVLQVVQGTTTIATNTTSSTFIPTGLQATITPTSTSSKILIISRQQMNGDIDNDSAGSATGQLALYRNTSAILTSASTVFARGGLTRIHDAGVKYLDSPSSTSALTYRTYIRMSGGSRSVLTDLDSLSTIILMEIAG